MDRMRRVIAKRMRVAATEIPHVTLHREVNATELLKVHEELNASMTTTNTHISISVLMALAVAIALREYPRINGRTENGEIRLYHQINLGIAVALNDGLAVPVIRNADQRSTSEFASELNRLVQRARTGTLSLSDVTDGTFTVSNLGAFGVDYFTPIINPPQLGILGVGAITTSLRLVEGELREVPQLGLSLSFDHAALDGASGAQFLSMVARYIESPSVLL